MKSTIDSSKIVITLKVMGGAIYEFSLVTYLRVASTQRSPSTVERGLQNPRLRVSLALASILQAEYRSYSPSRGFGMFPPTYSLACPTVISGIYRAASLCPKEGNFLHVHHRLGFTSDE